MAQEIFLDFDAEDNPIISVKGAKGKACKSLTADLERSLGAVVSSENTSEYNEREESHVAEGVSNRSGR